MSDLDITTLPAGKDNAVVMLDRLQYVKKVNSFLEDETCSYLHSSLKGPNFYITWEITLIIKSPDIFRATPNASTPPRLYVIKLIILSDRLTSQDVPW